MENNTNFQTFHQMGQAINDFVKQATGRDSVQNIDIDHVTVAQTRRYEEIEVSGTVVSFIAHAPGLPIEKCVVQIEPVQDLHGYDNPWPGGGGKNLINIIDRDVTVSGLNIKVKNGVVTLNGTTTNSINYRLLDNMNFDENTYIFSIDEPIPNNAVIAVQSSGGNKVATTNGTTFTASMTGFLWFYANSNQTFNNFVFKPMIRFATEADPTFEPYSNICPITGWTAVKVYRAGENLEDATVFEIALPAEAGTVYGGTLDVVSGELIVDCAGLDLGTLTWVSLLDNSDWKCFTATIPTKERGYDNFLCSQYPLGIIYQTETDCVIFGNINNSNIYIRDNHYTDVATFKTAMSGVQLVYELASPITYQLTPTEITTLLGENNIWADTGDIEVKIKDLKELY